MSQPGVNQQIDAKVQPDRTDKEHTGPMLIVIGDKGGT